MGCSEGAMREALSLQPAVTSALNMAAEMEVSTTWAVSRAMRRAGGIQGLRLRLLLRLSLLLLLRLRLLVLGLVLGLPGGVCCCEAQRQRSYCWPLQLNGPAWRGPQQMDSVSRSQTSITLSSGMLQQGGAGHAAVAAAWCAISAFPHAAHAAYSPSAHAVP